MPPGTYRTAVGVTGSLVGQGNLDPNDPAVAHRYFTRLFATLNLDAKEIQKLRKALDYPEVAAKFRMIDEETLSVVVRFGTVDEQKRAQQIVEALRRGVPNARSLLRQIQPWLVSVRVREAQRYAKQGWIAPVMDGLGEWMGDYDPVSGLLAQDPDPGVLVV